MANENETMMDVCSEWRECIEAANPSVWDDERIAGLVKTTKAQQLAYLDRIEAAWKREREELDKRISDLESYAKLWTDRADELRLKCDEFYAKAKPVGNAAALREALEKIYTCVDDCYNYDPESKLDEVIGIADAALSAPPRQCDVGTAEEHAQRFYNFCESNSSGINGMCKPTCPCIDCFDKCQCFAKWAQMPYEDEEGAEHGKA